MLFRGGGGSPPLSCKWGLTWGYSTLGKVGLDTAWNFALGLPKHDLGWPSLRPLFRDSIIDPINNNIEVNIYETVIQVYVP